MSLSHALHITGALPSCCLQSLSSLSCQGAVSELQVLVIQLHCSCELEMLLLQYVFFFFFCWKAILFQLFQFYLKVEGSSFQCKCFGMAGGE